MILQKIAKSVKVRVEERKAKITETEMKSLADKLEVKDTFPFKKALQKEGISYICEVKKASPSKGLIAPNFPYLDIAKEYEKVGGSAISVLTEEDHFQGSGQYLKEISNEVSLPVLRKDFIIDEYQIYEAKVLGASAILLIVALLEQEILEGFYKLAKSLGLSVLVEVHDEEELEKALAIKAEIIGVNNRNLKTFTVDLGNSLRLRKMVPSEIVFVAESGIKTREDIARLEEAGVDAVLIGETLMLATDKQAKLDELRGLTK